MKANFYIFFAIYFFIVSSEIPEIEFNEEIRSLELYDSKEFIYLAKYKRNSGKKYLYIYPKNYVDEMYMNKAIIKIYFKEIPNKDSFKESSLNYLYSDYSSIDFNSGLFIKLSDLHYDTAIIYIISYEICNLMIQYKYADEISFPSYFKYSNFQLNQFILKEGATETINHKIIQIENDYLLILSKTSLRNIEVKVEYKSKDVTDEKLAYLYPNGCSVFLEKKYFDNQWVKLSIKNNNNRQEVILLGYVHHVPKEIFPNEIVNGFQLYLEANQNELANLLISGKEGILPYFTYQLNYKNLEIYFLTSENQNKGKKIIREYNSMFSHKIDFIGKMNFEFLVAPKRSAMYFQYLDFSDNEVAQKSLQSLVTGVPKSMIIPERKSMYHFLPKERDSNYLHYYLRAKTEEKIFVSYKSCTTYPFNCTFNGKGENAIEVIKNIGFWSTIPRNKQELQLIYIYCEKECAYDILISYEKDDPLFLFPENDYTKMINDSSKDIFALPVFESFESSKIKSIYIDLTIISGKAKILLKNGREGKELKYTIKKIGSKQSFNISSEIFLNDTNYFKKEIYAVVEQDSKYKNTIYNIMYGTGNAPNTKFLSNKLMNIELLTVGEKNNESTNSKIFNFINNENRNLYISISTQLCKSKVLINNTLQYESFSHSYKIPYGSSNFEVYLLNDNNLCNVGFEEEVILFSYYLNQNVLLTENSFINMNISEKVSFIHIFKPNENENSENSFNLGIERLDKNPISFSYEINRISFNGLDNIKSSGNSSQKINSKKIRYISNQQIKKICGSLKQYEICSLTMNFIPSSSSYSKFSFYLSKNGLINSKYLTERALIGSVNTKSVQYFYIDINENKNKKLELILNSYGNDLKYNFEVKNTKQEDDDVLPLKKTFSEGSNNHQTIIDQSHFSNCKDFCRLYIGVASNSLEDEVSSLFYIGYRFLNVENSFINIPLNYFTQYIFKDLNEVNFIINPIEDDDFTFELYVIKQNENDNTEVIADISGSITYQLKSTEGKCVKAGLAKEIKVKIIKDKGNDNSAFKFRVSSIGKGNSFQGFIPMISSYEEKCLKKPCYYIVDDFSLDNEETSAYFYIPEKESSVINIKALKYDEKFTDNDYISSIDKMKRSNWYEYSNINREKDVIIKIEDNDKITICPSYYNKPNNVTLNYGEKRMFTLRKKKIEKIILNIKQPSIPKSKVKINIHSIRGNGIIKFNEEIYPIGLENSYKEDITLIIDDNKLYNIQLIVINEKNGKADDDNDNAADFVFTIEYKIDLIDQLLYEIKYDKINSYKFYRKEKIDEVSFYLDITKRSTIGLNMNIKVYSNSTQYNIKSYFVNNNFIQKRLNNSESDSGLNVTGEIIKTYIQGGNSINDLFTFAKLEISPDNLQKNSKDYPFVCIVFTPKEKKNNYVKFDLYPYEMNNTIPLARNQLFIQKIPPNNDIYKLFLCKSDIFYRKNVKIDFVPPILKEYDYAIAHFDSSNKDPIKNESEFISDQKEIFGKEEITLNSLKNTTQKYIIFNLFPKDNSKIEDYFIFSYKNQKSDEEEEIYIKPSELFNVTGDSKEVKYTIHAPASKITGHTILISRVYEYEKIEHLKINENNDYLPLYLLFSDIKPIFVKYDVLTDINIYDSKRTIPNKIKKGGDLYFTAICILEDNERELYFAYKGIRKEIDDKNALDDLLDYMKDHILASIIILIVILIILGMIINICRAERKVGRLSSIKVDVEGKLMEDKAD